MTRPAGMGAAFAAALWTAFAPALALCLYDYQVLSTGQLQLLFFSSKRRCQDRLLFLYRHRAQRERPVLDEQRRTITAEITRIERSTERYFEAFEQGRLSPSAANSASRA